MNSSTIIGLDAKKLDKFGKELKKLNASKKPSEEYPPPNPAGAAPAGTPPLPAGTTVKPAEKPGAPPGTPATPGSPPPAPAPAGPVAIKNAQQENWTNAEGKVIQAKLIEVDGENITFEIGGNKVPYQISKLADASKKRIEELKAASQK
jgi:hypothetical protein